MNIDKFTNHAKLVISNAQIEAAKNDHQQILPLHLLKVLLNEDAGIISNLVTILKVDLVNLNNRVESGNLVMWLYWPK